MSDDNTYRVWVGCLACYNDGKLIGEWFDAAEAPTNGQEFADAIGRQECAGFAAEPHEELWVMDFENSPIDREHSVSEAVEAAGWMSELDEYETPAFLAYLKAGVHDLDSEAVEAFRDCYQGEWPNDEDFAQQLAEDLGAVNEDATWPNNYIDWERAARDLMMDYFKEGDYYFRH